MGSIMQSCFGDQKETCLCDIVLSQTQINQLKFQELFPHHYQRMKLKNHRFACNIIIALNALRRYFPRELEKIIKIKNSSIILFLSTRQEKFSLKKKPVKVIFKLHDCQMFKKFKQFRQEYNRTHPNKIQYSTKSQWDLYQLDILIESITYVYNQEIKLWGISKENKGFSIPRVLDILIQKGYCCFQLILREPTQKIATYALKLLFNLKRRYGQVVFLTFGKRGKNQQVGHAGTVEDESHWHLPENVDPTPIQIGDDLSNLTLYAHAILSNEAMEYYLDYAINLRNMLNDEFKNDKFVFTVRYVGKKSIIEQELIPSPHI